MANKLHEVGYDVRKEGPLISFYPEDDLDMSLFTKEEVVDTWKINSSLEEIYLKAVADEEVET